VSDIGLNLGTLQRSACCVFFISRREEEGGGGGFCNSPFFDEEPRFLRLQNRNHNAHNALFCSVYSNNPADDLKTDFPVDASVTGAQ